MEAFEAFLINQPHYGYLFGAVLFGFYLFGLIMDWNWTVEPGGGAFNIQDWINLVGRKTVRIVMGTISFIGLSACLALFFSAQGTFEKFF